MSDQYWAVYRILKNGKRRYMSRTVTANEKLAREIARGFSNGVLITATGKEHHIRPIPCEAAPVGTYPDA